MHVPDGEEDADALAGAAGVFFIGDDYDAAVGGGDDGTGVGRDDAEMRLMQVVQDNSSVSFMWSFPNFIPLSAPRVEGVINALKPYKFDRIHGAFTDRTIWSDGKGVVGEGVNIVFHYPQMLKGTFAALLMMGTAVVSARAATCANSNEM